VVPTLLLSGSKHKNTPAPMMAKMATYVPSARYIELEASATSPTWNVQRPAHAALDPSPKANVAATSWYDDGASR
jgi:3-oxoadipate enol-lactonase